MHTRALIDSIARRILYLWVKTEVVPAHIDQLEINPGLPTIYVLRARDWSNLLVLEEECERLGLPKPLNPVAHEQLNSWRSVYTIAPAQPFKAWLLKKPERSRMLRGIVEILREHPQQEIQFIPVAVFWGRPVSTQKHWIQVLFADSWGLASRTRKFFTILFHGRNTLLNFSEIISFRLSGHAHLGNDTIVDNLQNYFSRRHNELRSATLGPDISHRRTLVRELILRPDVQQAIRQKSEQDNIDPYKAANLARKYLREIVANSSTITVQIMQRLLTGFLHRFYSGIEVTNAEILGNLALNHELVYVPCHRSHIDYLLLSYLIYHEGLAIPNIAAGKNLNMPVIGPILRGGGAFFIRRSFKGNQLYSTVMFEYIAEQVSKGVPLEYFIEGGRSRTGRLLQPMPGMLAMTIRGFLKYRKKPVVFIPVYIGYEKLMEARAYQAELSGAPKKSETLINSIRSILKIRGKFGKVSANFGKPVFLNKIINRNCPALELNPYNDAERPPWMRAVVSDTALQIMQRINQAVSVNAVNLVSAILLSAKTRSMPETELVSNIELHRSLIKSLDYSGRIIITHRSGAQIVRRVESLDMVSRRPHELGDILQLTPAQVRSATWFRNNILHLLTIPALIACCYYNVRSLTRFEIIRLVSIAYPSLRHELFLKWEQQELPRVIDNMLMSMTQQGLLVKNAKHDIFSRRGTGAMQYNQLMQLANVIEPVLEIYYLTLVILSRQKTENLAREQLLKKCHLMAERMSLISENDTPDYSDKKLISNFIDALIRDEYIQIVDDESMEYSTLFRKADRRIRLMLPNQVRTRILQMLSGGASDKIPASDAKSGSQDTVRK